MENDIMVPAFVFNERQVVIICPYCGNAHYHGLGDGYRCPHCLTGKTGSKYIKQDRRDYCLVLLKDKTPDLAIKSLSLQKQLIEKSERRKVKIDCTENFIKHMENVVLFNKYWLTFGDKAN